MRQLSLAARPRRRSRQHETLFRRTADLGRAGLHGERLEHHPRSRCRNRPLERELPEILVEGEDHSAVGFRALQQGAILQAGAVRARPNDIVTMATKNLDNRTGKVLVCEKSHSRRNWVGLVLVREIARVGQTGEDVLSGKTRIVRQNLAL